MKQTGMRMMTTKMRKIDEIERGGRTALHQRDIRRIWKGRTGNWVFIRLVLDDIEIGEGTSSAGRD